MRYYIPISKVLPFFELNDVFGSIKYKSDFSDSKSSVLSFGGGIGLAVPLGDKVTFHVLAGYHFLTVKEKGDNDANVRT